MKKKLISIFTIVCMLTTFMPTLAFAFDGDDTNPDDSNTEIVLNAEGIELSGGQGTSESVVLDGVVTPEPDSSGISGDTIYDYDATATHRDREGNPVIGITDNYKAYTCRSKDTYEKIQTGQTFTSKKLKVINA